jgi:hypothetical protein
MRAIFGLVMAASLTPGVYGQSTSGTVTASVSVLPKDIDSESYSRLPLVKRADLDPDGQRIYDMLAGGPGKTVGATGPAAISLYSPKVAEAIQMLNQYLRFHGVLKARDFEVAILVGGPRIRSAV